MEQIDGGPSKTGAHSVDCLEVHYPLSMGLSCRMAGSLMYV